MRLHRHDDIVEAMARGVLESTLWPDAWVKANEVEMNAARHTAAAALNALLEAAVRLGVGKEAAGTYGHQDRGAPWVAAEHWVDRLRSIDHFPALILRMEARDDK